MFFRAPAFADVARGFRCTGNPAVRRLYRRNRERNLNQTPILAPAYGLKMIDTLAAPDAPQNLYFLSLALRRDQDRDGLADHLCGRVAKEPLGAAIPTANDAIQVFADDGVIRGVNDRGQA